jgi:glycosyltransferase involved in cell wall biosynthesis
MANEMRRNGVASERVHVVPPFVTAQPGAARTRPGGSTCRLLYLGRLERLKGVDGLLRALGPVAQRLNRAVHLVVAGDGGEREALTRLAADICARDPRVSVQFAGWMNDDGRADLLAGADALVVPSVWPEPFGLVGLEAAAAGVPAVGFDVGGIPEWLRDGETGCLASSAGDRVAALSDAIVRCVGTQAQQTRLADGARRFAARATIERHVAGLEQVFNRVVPALCAGAV